MHIPVGQDVLALCCEAASSHRMALDIRWQEVDQMIYPGQQLIVVGWSTNEGAPQLRVYRSSGLKQFTSCDAGELVVDKVGDWSPAAEDQEDLADVLYGLERLFLELAKLQKVTA
jgi:hypothetical protein